MKTPEAHHHPRQEFHIRKQMREALSLQTALFSISGAAVFADLAEARRFAYDFELHRQAVGHPDPSVPAGDIIAMGVLDEVMHSVLALEREESGANTLQKAVANLARQLGSEEAERVLRSFCAEFPPAAVYRREQSVDDYLESRIEGLTGRERAVEEMILLRLTNENPACGRYSELFAEKSLQQNSAYDQALAVIENSFSSQAVEDPDGGNARISVFDLLRAPARAHPDSLEDQLAFVRDRWGSSVGRFLPRLLRSMDVLREEAKIFQSPAPGTAPAEVYRYDETESERFSPDTEWMPGVVMMAKSTLVWLHQLGERYGREITRIDQVPDEEIDGIAASGFNTLWLIGLWERSPASRRIKHLCGNPEAEASAYALYSYDIAQEIGGWQAFEQFRARCAARGIRLASDMVPNHTGIDSPWVHEHPDWFINLDHPPYPSYSFTGENLSGRGDRGVYLEDHYLDRSDAAVVFKHVDAAGRERFIYHGNDGTSMPWNDTAQLDYLKAEVREAVIQAILHVARNFPVIRFDAAMTLARRHVRRLWYPEPGSGGAIASRAEHGLSAKEFDRAMPQEFWREVVDRVAAEAPDTLLLAEAFWMMEGYFVRTLGMHRVYNSAFMNMFKREQNAEYREIIRNTLSFDPEILKRFVNFMNNPDEETAVTQFGTGDKYFGVATMLATMPGLPMFGHGQIEGLAEKYGMEFRRPYWNEEPDAELIARHEREIFPLLRRRELFASVTHFRLYDFRGKDGAVNENVFAYSNEHDGEHVFVAFNNAYDRATGSVREYVPSGADDHMGSNGNRDVAAALGLSGDDNSFLVLQEQRTGLWHLYRCADIRNRGLPLELDGYQVRVLWNIHERVDDDAGNLARLERELRGSGVPDVETAVAGLAVAPVREAFASFATEELLRELDEALQGFRVITPMRFDEIRTEYRTVLAKAVAAGGSEVGPALRSFERQLSAVIAVPHQTGGRSENGAYKRARGYYYTGIRAQQSHRRFALAWIFLSSLVDAIGAARALRWGVSSWVGAEEPLRNLLQATLARTDTLAQLEDPAAVARDLFDDEATRRAVGFHMHAGVAYYHVDSLAAVLWALFVAAFIRLLSTTPVGARSVQTAAVRMFETVEAIAEAADRAKGRRDELFEALGHSEVRESALRQSASVGNVERAAPGRSSESRQPKDEPEQKST